MNAANNSLTGGGGVDGAIHRAAGSGLLNECRQLHGCRKGEAKITGAYNLSVKHVIHTAGPVWHGGNEGDEQLLSLCYYNSLVPAAQNGIMRIAFPSVSAGAYGYHVMPAAKVAVRGVLQFDHEYTGKTDDLILVLFDENTYACYEN